MVDILEEKINEIIKFAHTNNSTISYNIVVDILKDKGDLRNDCSLEKIMNELFELGITIVPESSEEYPDFVNTPEQFVPSEVNIGQRPINVYNLMERLENNEIDLKPDFQRKDGLWSLEQQSRLIESLMLKIPIPAFYFNAVNDDFWVVIDGLQRLTAFSNFLVGNQKQGTNEIEKEKFVGLQYLRDFNGHTFDELPRQYIRRIKETALIAYTVEKGTPDEVVFNIFQRINTGGVKLEDQEIRQALYQGKSTELIKRMAECKEFLEATQYQIKTNRMQDREYATSFLAFTELDYLNDYNGDMDNYLIKAMKLVNTYQDEQLCNIEKNFKRIMGYCHRIFGKYAFRRYDENWHRSRISRLLFEMWVVCFFKLSDIELKKRVQCALTHHSKNE